MTEDHKWYDAEFKKCDALKTGKKACHEKLTVAALKKTNKCFYATGIKGLLKEC